MSVSRDKISSIYFDGRKDKTLVKVKKGDKWYGEMAVEDHYVLVTEPGGEYLTHITPDSGRSSYIATGIMSVIQEQGASETVCVVGCDSTNTNTGCNGGVIRHMEMALGRPLQWSVCMLHTNELPLRHLFMHFDGTTSGATTFVGSIGKAIQSCENNLIVSFTPITGNRPLPVLDESVFKDLSTDQKYLYDMFS